MIYKLLIFVWSSPFIPAEIQVLYLSTFFYVANIVIQTVDKGLSGLGVYFHSTMFNMKIGNQVVASSPIREPGDQPYWGLIDLPTVM